MEPMIVGAGLALLVLMAVAALRTGYRLWRAGMGAERPLLIYRVLERGGFSLDRCADPAAIAQTGAAARRCLLCRDRKTCVAWLAGDGETSLQRFCPNAELIGRLSAKSCAARPIRA